MVLTMNETPVAKKLTSTEARLVRINKDGAPELAKAVKDGLIGNWTATHMIVEKWPLTLQSMVAKVMRDEKAKAEKLPTAVKIPKAAKAVKAINVPLAAEKKNDGITVGSDGKVDMNIKPAKKAKKVKAVKLTGVTPNEEDAFEASVNAEVNS